MDWPNFIKRILLYQGRINEVEAELIERSILEEGVLHREELEFLLSLKKEAKWVHPRFDKFVFKVLKKLVLKDGIVDDKEAHWLRKIILADQQITPVEQQFLEELHREARSAGPEFVKLYKECTELPQTEFGY